MTLPWKHCACLWARDVFNQPELCPTHGTPSCEQIAKATCSRHVWQLVDIADTAQGGERTARRQPRPSVERSGSPAPPAPSNPAPVVEALRTALDDSTSLLESLVGSYANEDGMIDAQISDNRKALALPAQREPASEDARGEPIALGLDLSQSDDHTAIIVHISDRHALDEALLHEAIRRYVEDDIAGVIAAEYARLAQAGDAVEAER